MEDLYDMTDPEVQERQEFLETQAAAAAEAEAKEKESPEEPADGPVAESDHETPSTVRTTEFADPSDEDDTEPADESVPAGDDSTPEVTAEGEVAAEEPEPQFDPTHLAALGLTAEEAKEQLGTPTAVRNAVRLLDQRSVSVARQVWERQQAAIQQQHQFQQPMQQAPPPVQPQMPPAAPQQTQPIPAGTEEFKLPEPSDGEEWDPDVEKLFKEIHQQFNTKLQAQQQLIEEMRQQTQTFEQQRAAEENRRYVQEFDRFVNSLGDEWTSVLGKGDGFSMDPNSPAIQARTQLDQYAAQLAFGRQQQGLPDLSREELLHRALALSFPEVQKQTVEREVKQKVMGDVEKRQKMMTNRPQGRRRKSTERGPSAAVNHAERWYAERGMAPMLADDFDYDEI